MGRSASHPTLGKTAEEMELDIINRKIKLKNVKENLEREKKKMQFKKL
jgi:hypothetical protein